MGTEGKNAAVNPPCPLSFANLTPAERRTMARIGALKMHSQHDSAAITARARSGFLARFDREVDPDGTLDPETRKRRAHFALRAYMTNLRRRVPTGRRG